MAKKHNLTLGDLIKVVHEIKNSKNHSYTKREVESFLNIEQNLYAFLENLEKIFIYTDEIISQGFVSFGHRVKSVGDPILSNLKLASEKGWYISPKIIANYRLKDLKEMLEEKSLKTFEKALLKDSDQIVPEILKKCTLSYPKRKHIFNEILSLYKDQHYYSLINLSYSQIDGICNDIWGFGFFDKDKNDEYNLKFYQKFRESENEFVSILKNQLEIKKNEITQNSQHSDFIEPVRKNNSFNRHLVLHGHSVNYGNKINAIRAIYLLNFIEYFNSSEKQIN